MKIALPLALSLTCAVLLGGCASTAETVRDGWRESPTGSLLRGDVEPSGYLAAVKRANEDANRREQFEVNRRPDRVFNTSTQRFEPARRDQPRVWNPEAERWEYSPVEGRERPNHPPEA